MAPGWKLGSGFPIIMTRTPPCLGHRFCVNDCYNSTSQGPVSVFSAKQRWTAPRTIRLHTEDHDLGFTLKGDGPTQVQCLDPLCPAAVSPPDPCASVRWNEERSRIAKETVAGLVPKSKVHF